MTPQEAMADALARHPDCSYAEWANGMDPFFRITIVVKLWRNEECYFADDPPRYVVEGGYLFSALDKEVSCKTES